MSQVKLIDESLPKEQQVPFSLHEFTEKKKLEIREGKKLSATEIEALNQLYKGDDPSTMLMFNSRINLTTGQKLDNLPPSNKIEVIEVRH